MAHAINCTDPEHTKQNSCVDFTEKNFDQLMQLFHQHTEQAKREARIEERKSALYTLQQLKSGTYNDSSDPLQLCIDDIKHGITQLTTNPKGEE